MLLEIKWWIYNMIDNLLTFNINSINKKSGWSDNFIYNIEIDKQILWKITHVSITNVTIPKWFYSIWNNYNEFHLIENNNVIDIIIPVGNYSKSQFYSKISSILTSNSMYNINYTLWDEYGDHDTGKIKYTAWNNINNYQIRFQFFDNNDIYQA